MATENNKKGKNSNRKKVNSTKKNVASNKNNHAKKNVARKKNVNKSSNIEERGHDNLAKIAERDLLLRAEQGDQPEKEGGSESAHGKERNGRNNTRIGDILGRDNVYSENRICRQKGQMPCYVPLSAHFAPPGLDEQSGHIPFMI